MKSHFLLKVIIVSSFAFSSTAFSDVVVSSPLGTKLIFSEKFEPVNHDPYAWKKLSLIKNGHTIDLEIKERYFTEDGTSQVSPSGRYFVVNSLSGGYLYTEDGGKKYVDRAYCSVVDMKTGCYVSDWNGEACGYNWNKSQDILENASGSDVFDFQSSRPIIKEAGDLSLLDESRVKNYLRCDAPNRNNINTYQSLIKQNKASGVLVLEHLSDYLKGITSEKRINAKTYLFSSPADHGRMKAYLVPGDNVKVIQNSADNKWVNIGYINARGVPLVAWVVADSLAE